MHDYMPDFIVASESESPAHQILETKGFDEREEVKRAAAERWVAAVNTESASEHGSTRRRRSQSTCLS